MLGARPHFRPATVPTPSLLHHKLPRRSTRCGRRGRGRVRYGQTKGKIARAPSPMMTTTTIKATRDPRPTPIRERSWATRRLRPEEDPEGDGRTLGAHRLHDSVKGDGGRDIARVHDAHICHAEIKEKKERRDARVSDQGTGKKKKNNPPNGRLTAQSAQAAKEKGNGRERKGRRKWGRQTHDDHDTLDFCLVPWFLRTTGDDPLE